MKNSLKDLAEKKQNLLSLDVLKSKLSYSSETGIFTRNCVMTGSSVGAICGSLRPTGYVIIAIDGMFYRAHRLAWFYVYGKWPIGDVDHINRNRSDNRITNLREASRSDNLCNSSIRRDNTTGVKCVSYNKANKNYTVRVLKNGKAIERYGIKTLQEAKQLVEYIKPALHGDFANQ